MTIRVAKVTADDLWYGPRTIIISVITNKSGIGSGSWTETEYLPWRL